MSAKEAVNDSIITAGLDIAEATEQSIGEIAEGMGDRSPASQAATVEPQQQEQTLEPDYEQELEHEEDEMEM